MVEIVGGGGGDVSFNYSTVVVVVVVIVDLLFGSESGVISGNVVGTGF